MSDILTQPVINFYEFNNFVWDYFLHYPVLKSDFVADKTGIDLIVHTGSDIQANRLLTQIAIISKDFMFSRLPYGSQKYQEFRISRDINALEEVLAYQLAFVISATNGSGLENLYSSYNSDNKPYVIGLENAFNTLSSKFRSNISVPDTLYRKGY